MSKNTCREDLKNYALRKLGYPALQINVTPEQIDDRIDDTLSVFWEFHHEGSYHDFVTHVLTQNEIASKTIVVDDWIYSVLGVMRLGAVESDLNLQYISYMQNLGTQFLVMGTGYPPGEGLVSYTVNMSYLSMVRDFFSREKIISFNQFHNTIRIESSLDEFAVGDYLVFEVYRFCDPDSYRKTWNSTWLKNYTTALIKKQWGQNMLKYDGFQLPSGISLSGRAIYQDAIADIQELEQKLQSEETLPTNFFVRLIISNIKEVRWRTRSQ